MHTGEGFFPERLKKVLSGRKLYPWAADLGISKGAAESMGKGNLPGPEIQHLIMRRENVSLTWLNTGRGNPYLVDCYLTADEMAEVVADHLIDSDDWKVVLHAGDGVVVVELSMPAEFDYKGKAIPYTVYEFIAGPVGRSLVTTLADYGGRQGLWVSDLPADRVSRLVTGDIGVRTLYGDQKQAGDVTLSPVPWDQAADRLSQLCPSGIQPGGLNERLLNFVLRTVTEIAADDGVTLEPDTLARITTAVYDHIIRTTAQREDAGEIVRTLFKAMSGYPEPDPESV